MKKPIARVRCKMQMSLYEKNGDTFSRTKGYLKIGEEHYITKIENNMARLSNGFYITELTSKHVEIYYGTIQILKDVFCCSRSGFKSRKIHANSTLKVINIIELPSKKKMYQINSQEYLIDSENINFISIAESEIDIIPFKANFAT